VEDSLKDLKQSQLNLWYSIAIKIFEQNIGGFIIAIGIKKTMAVLGL